MYESIGLKIQKNQSTKTAGVVKRKMNMNSSWGKNLGYFAIFSPLAMIIGYAILMARSGQGPDTGWFLSHVFLLIGVGLMIPTSIGIKVILNQVAR